MPLQSAQLITSFLVFKITLYKTFKGISSFRLSARSYFAKIRVLTQASLDDVCIFFYFSQIYNLLYNGAISKYVVRKHLSGAIIQWWFSYIYCALCCACVYSSPSLWSFKSEGLCRFSLRLTFNGLLNSVT
jgi:hypothetical protein